MINNLFLIKNNLKKVLILPLFFLLLLNFNLFSQSDDGGTKIIYKIIFKGLKKAKANELTGIILSEQGKELDLNTISQDYQNLFALGYFEDIIISTDKAYNEKTKEELKGKVNLIFEFIEKATIRKLIFKGNKNLSYGSLIDSITIKRGDFLDLQTINSDITSIKDKYHEKGFNYVKVTYEVFQDEELKSKNKIDLTFNVEEGIETYISDIILRGNNNLSDFTIKSKMKTKERKYLGIQKGIFTENVFQQDLEEIKKIYRDMGYYMVDILEPEITRYEIVEKEQKKEVIRINIFIKEGDQYRFGGLIITGNKIIATDDLLYGLKLKEGQVFNFSRYQEIIQSIQIKYTNKGYIQTMVNDKIEMDKKNKIITATIEIKESKLSYIEAIYFKGNEKTKDYVLRRAVATEVGEIFNYDKLMTSIINLYNLGFFSNIDQDIQGGSAPGLLIITYILDEQKTAEVRFGVSIPANNWPPEITLFAEINEKNFLGRELVASGKVEASLYKQGFNLSIDDPWFLNYPWSFGANAKFYHNWYRLVYKDLSMEALANSTTEAQLRENYSDQYYNNDVKNPMYIGNGNDFWNMGIHNLDMELTTRMGYRFLRYFNVSGSLGVQPLFTWLPPENGTINEVDDPTYHDIMNFSNGWAVKSVISSTFGISTTKRLVNPFEGIRYSFSMSYIFGHFDAFTINTKFTAYWKIFDTMFSDWPFQNVIVFNAGLSMIFPGFRNISNSSYNNIFGQDRYGNGPILYPTDYLSVDGFFSGRGWGTTIGSYSQMTGPNGLTNKGYVKMEFSLEYRFPIYDKIVWFAAFIDMINLVKGPVLTTSDGSINDKNAWKWWDRSYKGYDPLGIDNWYGSIGLGLEFTFPQLPLSFFVVKRFKINYFTGIEWVQDPSYANTGYLDFILSIVGYYF